MEDVKDLIREASRLAQFHFGYEELIWLADKTCRLTILKELQAEIPGVSIRGASFQSEDPNNYPSEYWELCIRFMLDTLDVVIKGKVDHSGRKKIFLSNNDFIYKYEYKPKQKKKEVCCEFSFEGLDPDVLQMLERHLTPEEIKVIEKTAAEFIQTEDDELFGYLIFTEDYFPDRATFEMHKRNITELCLKDGFDVFKFSNSFVIFIKNFSWLPFEDIVYQIIQKLKPAPEQGKEE